MWTQKRFFQTYFVILLKKGKKLTRYVLWDNKKLKLNRNFKRVIRIISFYSLFFFLDIIFAFFSYLCTRE